MSRFSALAVHEQPAVLRELVELLSSDTLRVETAQSAGEALAKIATRGYAVLLVAHCPPLLDGSALLAHSLALAPDALRFLLVGTGMEAVSGRGSWVSTSYVDDKSAPGGRQGPHYPVIRLSLGAEGRHRLVGVVRECVDLLGLLEGQRLLQERFGSLANTGGEAEAAAQGKGQGKHPERRLEARLEARLKAQKRRQALLDSLFQRGGAGGARGGPAFSVMGDLYAQLRAVSRQTVLALADGIEAKDPYTKGHCERVAAYALALAGEVGFSEEELDALELGAFLHDVGKIGIRDEVLCKPGPLDEEEWRHMREHVTLGCEIIDQIDMLAPAMPAVRSHHERWDGTGYPDRLEGEDIPLVGRLVAIADAYDAMATDRPYKDALPLEECERLLRRTGGSMYDPDLIEIFVKRRIGALYRPDYDDLEDDLEGGDDDDADGYRADVRGSGGGSATNP